MATEAIGDAVNVGVARGSFCDLVGEYDAGGSPATILKYPRDGPAVTAAQRRAFESEAALLACLDRAGLPSLVAADAGAPTPWLRYQWLAGASVLEHDGCIGPAMAAAIARGVLEHLVYLHRLGIVHGDISARNVLVNDGGRAADVALLDFGNAWRRDRPWRRYPPRQWRAPEQAAGSHWGEPADVYQVGCLVQFMLGRRVDPVLGRCGDPHRPPRAWTDWLQAVRAPSPTDRPTPGEAIKRLPISTTGRLSRPRTRDPRKERVP